MADLHRIYRELNPLQASFPPDFYRRIQALESVMDLNGRIDRSAIATWLPPLGFDWAPGSTSRYRARRAGTVKLLAAECSTAPSAGDATVTLTKKTTAGTETIATLTIPQGETMAEAAPNVPVEAGAWLGATVTTANGASGVSIAATMDVGS